MELVRWLGTELWMMLVPVWGCWLAVGCWWRWSGVTQGDSLRLGLETWPVNLRKWKSENMNPQYAPNMKDHGISSDLTMDIIQAGSKQSIRDELSLCTNQLTSTFQKTCNLKVLCQQLSFRIRLYIEIQAWVSQSLTLVGCLVLHFWPWRFQHLEKLCCLLLTFSFQLILLGNLHQFVSCSYSQFVFETVLRWNQQNRT